MPERSLIRSRKLRWFAALAAVVVLLAVLLTGDEVLVRLMPTPVSFRTGEIDPFVTAGTEAPGTDVPVFYATNRGAVIEKPVPLYTALPSERLRMGVAHVRIGDGTLDWETLHRLSTSDDPGERPIVRLDWLDPMVTLGKDERAADSPDAQAFFALVDKALDASATRDLLVYVHGSNNSVPIGAAQAAQLRHFTGRRMVVLAFLWPSAGSILKYFTDVANAAASVDPFVRLLEMLAAHTKAANIDVLAYSAGAQIVSPALVRLAAPQPGETLAQQRSRLRLSQIYYAAPDIDTRRFVDELARYIDIVDRVSVAANLNDSALRFAGLVHRNSRAGRPNPTELNAQQTEFLLDASKRLRFDLIKVDPNDIPNLPLRAHDFWYEDPWVSSDLLGVMLLGAEPERRGLLMQRAGSGVKFWTFPPDFDRRVRRLFSPAAASN